MARNAGSLGLSPIATRAVTLDQRRERIAHRLSDDDDRHGSESIVPNGPIMIWRIACTVTKKPRISFFENDASDDRPYQIEASRSRSDESAPMISRR
jgi:hypothetical protein